MSNRWLIAIAFAACTGLLVTAAPVHAQDRELAGFGSLVRETRMARALGLDETQQDRMRAIIERLRDEARPHIEAMVSARDGLRAATDGRAYDESEVRRHARLRADATVELTVLRARLRHELDALLTPEQLERKKKMRSKRKKRYKDTNDW